jgi:RimJ/RimL family protein N-acetyltransferase
MTEPLILQTDRLVLRPFLPSDAVSVRELAGDFAIADTTAAIPHPYPEGAAEQWIGSLPNQIEEGRLAVFAIVRREGDLLIGAIGLHDIDTTHKRAELGYWIGVPYWGQGYCTEAASAVLEYGFARLSLHRIYAYYFKRNPASGRVLEKCGMQREGCLRQHLKRWDRFEDLMQYGILHKEWLVRRGQ